MAWMKVEGWNVGRVWVDSTGRRTFYIRQNRHGKRHDVNTKCSTLRGALKELERWESDPENYAPAGSGVSLVLDDALIERYATWCMTNTDSEDYRWLEAKKRYLRWWAGKLGGKSLTSIALRTILASLEGQPSQKDRIVSIKHLYAWLRKTDQIDAADDPTLDKLVVPQSKPEQDVTGISKVIGEDDFRAALPHLDPVVYNICRLMAGTGCHLSEALRFMEAGVVDGLVVAFKHKGGRIHRVAVPPAVAVAARALKVEGVKPPCRSTVYRDILAACTAAGIEPWTPGRFRHTFATTAISRGVSADAVALALGHKGKTTTLSWYANTAVAPSVNGGYVE